LKDSVSVPNRYKFAIACLKLNKLSEAETALLNKFRTPDGSDPVPYGGPGYYLLGMICEKQVRIKSIIELLRLEIRKLLLILVKLYSLIQHYGVLLKNYVN
jgi:hypothetical protein